MKTVRKIRAYVKLPVTLTGQTTRQQIHLRNVSLTGCFLVTDLELGVGDIFSFYVETPQGDGLPLTGKVIRRQTQPDGYGVCFDPPDDDGVRRELAQLIANADDPPAGFD